MGGAHCGFAVQVRMEVLAGGKGGKGGREGEGEKGRRCSDVWLHDKEPRDTLGSSVPRASFPLPARIPCPRATPC